MAEIVVTQDELALRRRARRRLVGAVAIALTVVVILPMLFDSEPKPLGSEVDIHIPAQDTPFEASPALAPQVHAGASQPEPRPAEPTQSSVPAATLAASKPAIDNAALDKNPPVSSPPAIEKVQPKPESKAAPKAEAKPEPKPVLKADTPFASQGYFLQLGAFGSESNARLLHAKATAAGFNPVMVGTNGQYRVRIGPLPQHERALEMQARLKAKGFSPVLLGP